MSVVAAIKHALSDDFVSKARALDAVIPRRPPPGESARRNTEYPFEVSGGWSAPAEPGVFSKAEVYDFLSAAGRLDVIERAVSAVRKAPL